MACLAVHRAVDRIAHSRPVGCAGGRDPRPTGYPPGAPDAEADSGRRERSRMIQDVRDMTRRAPNRIA
jgi:hypothetical protein